MIKVIVVGGGAAGLMAAYSASQAGHFVTLLERNEKLGKKIYITGKGRCNMTNACAIEDYFDKIISNKKFMYSSLYSFTNHQTMDLFRDTFNLPIKIERGNRVFPESDKASDVTKSLEKALKNNNVDIRLNTYVKSLLINNGTVTGVYTNNGLIEADIVILACGGKSYASTGSDGNGYELAKQAGHTITELRPGLVPMNTLEDWPRQLQGLSLKNVKVSFFDKKKMLLSEKGEMLFTHFGVSGPLIITASSILSKKIAGNRLNMVIDMKPALSEEELESRILKDFNIKPNQQFKNSLGKLLPAKMISVVVNMSDINPDKPVNAVTKEERKRLAHLLKNMNTTITGVRGFNEAIITQGGVNTREINPSTLESRQCSGLYIVGEMLDIDAVTGGYNLQIAWSTGYLAGISI